LVLLAENREGYGNLCTLVTRARLDHPRGRPRVDLDTLARHAGGLFALTGCSRGWVPRLVARGRTDAACDAAASLIDIFERRIAIECWDHALPEERTVTRELIALARALDVPWVVTNDAHYAAPTGRLAHDVLVALKHGATLDEMGTRLRPNGEWYLKGPAQMARRWQGFEQGLAATLAIAERCAFRLEDVKPNLPAFPLPPGVSDDAYLAQLVQQGADERWGWRRTARHDAQIEHELTLIAKLGLAGYFLIVWDIVRFARREGILCQGRGSAANSAVCYALGITAVDPIKLELLFERFLSEERKEAPDIDIDFAHRDRERVLQYVYERYGREHAAMVCEHITWRGRSAVRDAARVLGFSVQQAEALATFSDRFSAKSTAEALRVDGAANDADGSAADPFRAEQQDAKGPAGYSKELDAKRLAENVGMDMMTGTHAVTRMRAEREAARREFAAGTAGARSGDALGARSRDTFGARSGVTEHSLRDALGPLRGPAAASRRERSAPPSPSTDASDGVLALRADAGATPVLHAAAPRDDAAPATPATRGAENTGVPRQSPRADAAREGDVSVFERRPQDREAVREPRENGHGSRPSGESRPNAEKTQSTNSLLHRAGLDASDPRVRKLADIVAGLHQAPRHRGIHVGGFVLTREPLHTVVPIEPAAMDERTVIQWEKDDLDPVGLVKIDLLGLGMLTVLQDCLKYIRATRGVTLDLGQLDHRDQAVYDDLCRADTVGVFQVESRAQMNTLPRLKPRCFYDLVVEVALIRPGPIQGDMVHPYLRRRAGEEAVTYPHPSLEPILKRTMGVPLFQEQGMQVAIAAAGFTPGEADVLRKAMGHKRSRERMADICQKMITGMRANGIPEDVALRIYNQINAFADYGFPESHAASFALIVYASAYLRHYYAAEYLCAMLNAQPMGFYSAGTLVEDAKRHGVRVLPVDATRSAWDHTIECADGTVIVPHDGVIAVHAALGARSGSAECGARSGDTFGARSGVTEHSLRDALGPRSVGAGIASRDALGPLRGPAAASREAMSAPPSPRTGAKDGTLASRADARATPVNSTATPRSGATRDTSAASKAENTGVPEQSERTNAAREGHEPSAAKRPQDRAAVRELCERGLVLRPSGKAPAVRLGFRSIRGLGSKARAKIERALDAGAFRSIHDFVQRTGLDQRALRFVAESGALDAFVQDEPHARRRRVALWRVLEAVRGTGGPLALFPETPVPSGLSPLSAPELTEGDYRLTGLSLNGHPMRHLRPLLVPNGVLTARDTTRQRDGAKVGVAGLVICRQRPGTAKGFVFLTLEDETGMLNVVVTPQRFERQALLITRSPLLLVRGTLRAMTFIEWTGPLLCVPRAGEDGLLSLMSVVLLGSRRGRHAVVLHVLLGGLLGVVRRLQRVPARALCLVRGGLVIAGSVRQLRRAMMLRGALVVIRGLAVMLCALLRHVDSW
jgi:DNA polymerase III alpha subunit